MPASRQANAAWKRRPALERRAFLFNWAFLEGHLSELYGEKENGLEKGHSPLARCGDPDGVTSPTRGQGRKKPRYEVTHRGHNRYHG